MNIQHQAEVREAHLGEGLVAQNAGVVDENVDAAPVRHHAADHGRDRRLVGDRRGHRKRLAARRDDFIGDASCGRRIHVVYDDLRAIPRQQQRMRTAQSTARSSNDRDARLQSHTQFPFRTAHSPHTARNPPAMNRAMRFFTASKSSDWQTPPDNLSIRPVRASVSSSAPVTK